MFLAKKTQQYSTNTTYLSFYSKNTSISSQVTKKVNAKVKQYSKKIVDHPEKMSNNPKGV